MEADDDDDEEEDENNEITRRRNSYSAEEDDMIGARSQDVWLQGTTPVDTSIRKQTPQQQQSHRNRKSLPTHFYRRIFAAGKRIQNKSCN